MGWTQDDMPDQAGRVALITGANSGLGYESAIGLARKGAQVIMACRSPDKAEKARQDVLRRAPGASIEVMALDLCSLASIRAFAADFCKRFTRLDILMNNAGIMVPPRGKTADGFELHIGTNHLGHFALTGLILPRLLETPSSRVVTVSSNFHLAAPGIRFNDLNGDKFYYEWFAYAQSKLANVLFAQELHRRLAAAPADLISVACHPGYTLTNLQKPNAGLVNNIMFQLIRPFFAQSNEAGAAYQLYAATDPSVRGGDFCGPRYGMRGPAAHVGMSPFGKDARAAARLWQMSEDLTGVRYEALAAS